MPNISPEKVRTPAGSDSYAMTNDMRMMGESIRAIVPVANVSERNAVASAMASAGRAASADNPLIVDRADAPTGVAFEITRNGTTWVPVAEHPPVSLRTASVVRPDLGAFGPSAFASLAIATLDAGSPPGLWAVTWSVLLKSSVSAGMIVRGTAGASNLTNDLGIEVPTVAAMTTLTTFFVHTGGALTLNLQVSTTAGTATAPPGSRITAIWQGPA